jgi:hypothetical protein
VKTDGIRIHGTKSPAPDRLGENVIIQMTRQEQATGERL